MSSRLDQQLLRAALRVLSDVIYGRRAALADIELVNANALPEDSALELDYLARGVAERAMRKAASHYGIGVTGVDTTGRVPIDRAPSPLGPA